MKQIPQNDVWGTLPTAKVKIFGLYTGFGMVDSNNPTVPGCDIFFLHKVNMFITLTFESSTAKSPAQNQKYGKILNIYLVVRFKICMRFRLPK